MLSGACLVALLGMLGLLLCGLGPAGLAPAVAVLLGALPFLLMREFIRRLAVAHLRMSAAIVIDVSVALLQIGGLAALAYFHDLTIARAYLVMGVACATACGGWFFAKRLPMQFKWSRALDDWRDNWRFCAVGDGKPPGRICRPLLDALDPDDGAQQRAGRRVGRLH